MAEQRDQSGVLFHNDKGGNDKRPDMRGNCMVDGVVKEVAAWKRLDRNGREYLTLSFSEPREKPQQQGDQGQRRTFTNAAPNRNQQRQHDTGETPF